MKKGKKKKEEKVESSPPGPPPPPKEEDTAGACQFVNQRTFWARKRGGGKVGKKGIVPGTWKK